VDLKCSFVVNAYQYIGRRSLGRRGFKEWGHFYCVRMSRVAARSGGVDLKPAVVSFHPGKPGRRSLERRGFKVCLCRTACPKNESPLARAAWI